MDLSIVILATLVSVLIVVALVRGGTEMAGEGLLRAFQLFKGVAPHLALGFILGGLITVVVPSEAIAAALGEGSGLRGLLIATGAGILTPGGPYIQFPLVAGLAVSGAGWGPVAAYLTAWSVIGANRVLVWELPMLGLRFTAVRWLFSLTLPLLVGLVVPAILDRIRGAG